MPKKERKLTALEQANREIDCLKTQLAVQLDRNYHHMCLAAKWMNIGISNNQKHICGLQGYDSMIDPICPGRDKL
jgi:hypothetical protein